MNWTGKFASRTKLMKRTAVRELLKVASRPEIISFAGGLPAAELFPVQRVKEAVDEVLERFGGKCLQYGETEGIAPLREWLAKKFSRPGFKVETHNVMITSGAQQALDLLGRVILDPSDRVLVENPTYLALLSAWRPIGVEFLPVGSDANGMQVERLDEWLPQKPKLMYLTPNFQNPQGTTLTRARRVALVSWARKNQVPVLEDNPYGELRYSGEPLQNLFGMDGDADESPIIYVGTFSKVLMPGLRVGWIIGPRDVIDKLVQTKQSADLHTSSLSQHVAFELVREGFIDEFLPVLVKNYKGRRDTMLEAMDKHFADLATWTHPEGGMFLLATLPERISTAAMLSIAIERGVAYVPGEEFFINNDGHNTMRLNFSNAKPQAIEEGIERLANVIRQKVCL